MIIANLGSLARGVTGDFSIFSNFLSRNSNNIYNAGQPIAYFGYAAANPDKVDHLALRGYNSSGNPILGFEDLYGGGDRDYNDAIFSYKFEIVPTPLFPFP